MLVQQFIKSINKINQELKRSHHHHASILLILCHSWGYYLCWTFTATIDPQTFDLMPRVSSFLPSGLTRLPHTHLLTLHLVPFSSCSSQSWNGHHGRLACLSEAMCACPGKAEGLAGISTLIPAITHPEGVITARPIPCRSQANECRRSSGSGQLPQEWQWGRASTLSMDRFLPAPSDTNPQKFLFHKNGF